MGISIQLTDMYETKWKPAKDQVKNEVVTVIEALEDEFGTVDGQLTVVEEDTVTIELYNSTIDDAADIFTDMELHVLNVVGVSGYTIGTSQKEATLKFV